MNIIESIHAIENEPSWYSKTALLEAAERKTFSSLRKELIGSIMTVKANAVLTTAKGSSLFLPRFVEMRADKQTADSLESIKEQFDNFFNLKESIS